MTTIRLQKSTRDKLASHGTKDSTFDQIILDLLKKGGRKKL